jgi:hypothetical protein
MSFEETSFSEKLSSIEVSENAKHEISFKIKVYFDTDKRTTLQVVDEINNTALYLKGKFNLK